MINLCIDFRFHYMVISDDKQRTMASQMDREEGQELDYPEAVLLTNSSNPQLRGEVRIVGVN